MSTSPHIPIYCYWKIWPWKSKVKVMVEVNVESHTMGPTFYRLTSLSFQVNQPSHSWDTAFSDFDLENPRLRSWVRWTLHRENSPVAQTTPRAHTVILGRLTSRKKSPPPPWPQGKPGLIALIGPLRPYCSHSLLISLRCVTEIKFAQNLRWLGNWR